MSSFFGVLLGTCSTEAHFKHFSLSENREVYGRSYMILEFFDWAMPWITSYQQILTIWRPNNASCRSLNPLYSILYDMLKEEKAFQANIARKLGNTITKTGLDAENRQHKDVSFPQFPWT